jgi:hypothetical protein
MRTIQSFILRLLVDTDQPEALHGVLRCVSDDTEQAFADETALVDLLRHWVNRSAQPSIPATSTGEPHES